MNRQARRQAVKNFQAQLNDPALAGAVDLANRSQAPKRVFMGYVAGPQVHTAWVRSLLATAARSSEFGYAVRPRDCESGPDIAKARNLLLSSFLETEDEYLLFTDTDIAFAPQDIAMLIAADAPIAGALYFTAATGTEPWPVALVEGEEGNYVPITLPVPPDDFDEADQDKLEAWMAELALPRPVAGVGMGLTLIKREVAERVAEKWERPFEYADGNSEDLTFCLRAGELGLDTVVVLSARVGHMKVTML